MIATLPRTTSAAAPSAPASSAVTRLAQVVLGRLAFWWRMHRDRRVLATLSDGMLDDIGLTRADIDRELINPFWVGIDYGALSQQRELAARTPQRGRTRL